MLEKQNLDCEVLPVDFDHAVKSGDADTPLSIPGKYRLTYLRAIADLMGWIWCGTWHEKHLFSTP